jgi:hypothetical protein
MLLQIGASFFGVLAAVFWFAAAAVRVPINLRAYVTADHIARVDGLEEMQIGFAWQRGFNALGAANAAIGTILQVIGTWLA